MSTLAPTVLASLPEDVSRFCEQHHLLRTLEEAVRLARECFNSIGEFRIVLEPDLETDDHYVVIDLGLEGALDMAMEQYQSYTERWVASAPAEDRHLIRLVFDLRNGGDNR